MVLLTWTAMRNIILVAILLLISLITFVRTHKQFILYMIRVYIGFLEVSGHKMEILN